MKNYLVNIHGTVMDLNWSNHLMREWNINQLLPTVKATKMGMEVKPIISSCTKQHMSGGEIVSL